MNVLITGGAGFIGSHMVEHLIANTDWNLILLDRLNYAGSLDRLAQFRANPRVRFHFHDIRAALPCSLLKKLGHIDYVIHSAAETHVDNSLNDPLPFIETNLIGTYNILQASKQLQVERHVHISTDEVFGPAPQGIYYAEDDRFSPTNPYSATKAGSDCLTMAWATSYRLPVILTRTMNNFGERQHPEKFVPLVIRSILHGSTVKIHSTNGMIGSRKWLHARNHADAVLHLLRSNSLGTYHIGGDEYDNLAIAQQIAESVKQPLYYELTDAHTNRPGHDLRYSLDDSKLRASWKPPLDFAESLNRCVEWTMNHREWLEG